MLWLGLKYWLQPGVAGCSFDCNLLSLVSVYTLIISPLRLWDRMKCLGYNMVKLATAALTAIITAAGLGVRQSALDVTEDEGASWQQCGWWRGGASLKL